MTNENPLTWDYWTGVVDARILALFRISLGAVLLQDLWPRIRGASTFLTDDGVFPRSLLESTGPWSLFKLTGQIIPVTLLLVAGGLATLAFMLGYATKAATAACWLFWVSLHRRVPVLHTGGDGIADILLFFGMFADLSGRWSFDAVRKGVRAEVPALVPRFMQIVPAVLYLYTAREKLRGGGRDWFFGPILFQHMHLQGWLRPAGVVLGEHPMLCALFTGGTILVESSLAFLRLSPFWIRPARALAVVLHVGLQLGILATMKVGVFTNVMLAITCLWLQPEWLDAAGGLLAPKQGLVDRSLSKMRGRVVTNAVLGALFLGTLAEPVIPRHLPRFVGVVVNSWLGLDIAAGLFRMGFPSLRWESTGVLADGTTIDPLRVAAPDADFSNGVLNSLWMQLPYRLEQYAPLGRFVCDRNNRHHDRPALSTWKLASFSRAPYLPGQPRPAEEGKLLLEEECASR